LGLGEEEFWGLTLAQFDALAGRHNDRQEREDYHAGLITAAIYNVNRDPRKTSRPFTPQDFMPGKKRQPLTAAQIKAQLELIPGIRKGVKKDG
jgi:hypothetical protein